MSMIVSGHVHKLIRNMCLLYIVGFLLHIQSTLYAHFPRLYDD